MRNLPGGKPSGIYSLCNDCMPDFQKKQQKEYQEKLLTEIDKENTMNRKITSLYDHFKNTPKKLKIVCDWDEVIQTCEPYALWKISNPILLEELLRKKNNFQDYFETFWRKELEDTIEINYSPYGSSLKLKGNKGYFDTKLIDEKQQTIKNSPNFYQEAPFLTIAEDLLKLIKENKVECLIFLSAYDKRKFSDKDDEDGEEIGDKRKIEIFDQTFDKLDNMVSEIGNDGIVRVRIADEKKGKTIVNLVLLGFDSEIQGQSKADWIKENASDFDIVIDDNPNICKSIELGQCSECIKKTEKEKQHYLVELKRNFHPSFCSRCPGRTVIAPYYPAIENQHDERVLLVKNKVSKLKKENFS